jgi:hypothetical protein
MERALGLIAVIAPGAPATHGIRIVDSVASKYAIQEFSFEVNPVTPDKRMAGPARTITCERCFAVPGSIPRQSKRQRVYSRFRKRRRAGSCTRSVG